jgi:hypothetical protein
VLIDPVSDLAAVAARDDDVSVVQLEVAQDLKQLVKVIRVAGFEHCRCVAGFKEGVSVEYVLREDVFE